MQAPQSFIAESPSHSSHSISTSNSAPDSSPEHFDDSFFTLEPPLLLALARNDGLLHDARNLVGAIRLYCDLLAEPSVLKAEHRHFARELRELCDRSYQLLERWMEPHPSAIPVLAAPRPLYELVADCASILQLVASGHTVRWHFEKGCSTPIRLPAEDLERILVNLVRNAAAALDRVSTARRATAEIRIRVGTVRHGSSICLTVEDDGCGIEPSQLDLRVTGPCARRGMGLQIVRELAVASGGHVRMASVPGRGTAVRVELPVAGSALEPAPQCRLSARPANEGSATDGALVC